MLTMTPNGLYCPLADVYIDPWEPVARSIITHAHSDHARSGSGYYLCHHFTKPVLQLRLGTAIEVESLAYGQAVTMNGINVSLHPAGHIPGSAQVRLEYKGEVWVVSGDYKLTDDGLSTPFEVVKCDHFITESTFGLPIYKFPSPQMVYQEMNEWWRQNAGEKKNTVLLAYALGKSQAILRHLDTGIGPVFLHGAVANVNVSLEEVGYRFPGIRMTASTDKQSLKGAVILAPPSALGSPWLKKMMPYKIGFCSGWMQLRGARRRYGVDRGFVLSDHADWGQLNEAVKATGAAHIYVTHGYTGAFSRWLKEQYSLDAVELPSLFKQEGGADL